MRDLRGSRVRITAWESRQAYGTVNVPQDLDLFRDDAEVIQSTQLSRVLIEIDDPAPNGRDLAARPSPGADKSLKAGKVFGVAAR
jgi:hypothetical protein